MTNTDHRKHLNTGQTGFQAHGKNDERNAYKTGQTTNIFVLVVLPNSFFSLRPIIRTVLLISHKSDGALGWVERGCELAEGKGHCPATTVR